MSFNLGRGDGIVQGLELALDRQLLLLDPKRQMAKPAKLLLGIGKLRLRLFRVQLVRLGVHHRCYRCRKRPPWVSLELPVRALTLVFGEVASG
jgi:hypothetical protein